MTLLEAAYANSVYLLKLAYYVDKFLSENLRSVYTSEKM
jgi:hypothetical protein